MLSYDGLAELLRPRTVFAKVAAGVLWVCYLVSILLGDGYGAFNLKGQLVLADHLAFYTAARLVHEGRAEKAYDYDFVAQYQNEMFPPGRWNSLEAFRNPPFYALLYYPTATWPFPASSWFWAAVQVGLLWVSIYWLALPAPLSRLGGRGVGGEGGSGLRSGSPPPAGEGLGEGLSRHPASSPYPSPQPPPPQGEGEQYRSPESPALTPSPSPAKPGEGGRTRLSPTRTFFWALTFYPVFGAVSFGQNTLLSLFAFAGCYRLLTADRRFLAGLAAGFLCFKPPLLLGLIVWGLLDFRRLWPCALGVVVMAVALSAGSYPLVPDMWAGFVRSLGANTAFDNFHQFKMHNPIAFWRLLLPDATDRLRWPLAAACSLAAVGCFVWLWWKRRHDLRAIFGGAVFLTLWASPHALIYEWALLLVPAVLWWPAARFAPNRWFVLYAAAWLALFVSTHLAEGQQLLQNLLGAADPYGDPNSPVREGGPLAGRTAAAVQLSVPALAWVGWSAARLLRQTGTPPPPESHP